MEIVKGLAKGTYSLEGSVWFPVINDYITLRVDDLDEISNDHVELLKHLDFSIDLKERLESVFWTAYKSYNYAVGIDESESESASEIWNLIRFRGARLDKRSIGEDTFIVLQVSARWESEHPYEVVIKNGSELVYLGSYLYYPSNGYHDIPANEGNLALRKA